MHYDRNPSRGFSAVFSGKQIASNYFHAFASRKASQHLFQAAKAAGCPNKTTEVPNAIFEQNLNDFSADESIGAGDKNAVLWVYNTV